MRTSESIVKLFEALVAAQAEFGGAKKDSSNPFFKSSYADLQSVIDAIKEPFKAHGLAFIQGVEAQTILSTMIIHKSGEWIETFYPLSIKDPSDPQKVGSAVTYAKRYGLQAAVGIPSIDDDGNEASGKPMQDLKHSNAQQVQADPQPVKAKFTPPASVQARAAAAPKAPAPLFPKVVEGSSDLGSFIIKFGKHKDKMLSEMDIYALDGYIKWLHKSAAETKKPMAPNAHELCEVGEAYLKSRMSSPEVPTWTASASGIDEEEPLPF